MPDKQTKTKHVYRVVMTPKDEAIAFVIKRNYGTAIVDRYTSAYSKEQAALQMRHKYLAWQVEFVVEE